MTDVDLFMLWVGTVTGRSDLLAKQRPAGIAQIIVRMDYYIVTVHNII